MRLCEAVFGGAPYVRWRELQRCGTFSACRLPMPKSGRAIPRECTGFNRQARCAKRAHILHISDLKAEEPTRTATLIAALWSISAVREQHSLRAAAQGRCSCSAIS